MTIHNYPRWTILTAIVLVIVVAAFVLASLPMETKESPAVQGRVLSVHTKPIDIADHYTVRRRYVGRVEASRASRLGFELDGLVNHVAVEEGDRVEKGDLIARLDTARLIARREELAAALNEAAARLSLAERTLDRNRKARDQNAISEQTFDESRQNTAVQTAVVRRIQFQIRSLDVNIDKSTMKAPFTGVVAKRHVDEGTVVPTGQTIVELLEMDSLEVRVGVASRTARVMTIGQRLPVQLNGEPIWAGVKAVLPERDPSTRTVAVILSLESPPPHSRHGDTVEVLLEETIQQGGFWLPQSALTEGSRGLWSCFVAAPLAEGNGYPNATHRLERRELELLHQSETDVFVRGTVSAGELVVVDGLHRIVAGQQVSSVQKTDHRSPGEDHASQWPPAATAENHP